ncbi:MAG: hypothetical protein QXW72_03895 [Conexivisphaerales archaeon]
MTFFVYYFCLDYNVCNITSWHDYNEALVERGSVILDFLEGGATGDERQQ